MTDDIEALRRHSLWLARLVLFLLVATAAVILLPLLLAFAKAALAGQAPGPRLVRGAILWLPSIFYLYALWSIGGAFRAFARGGVFGAAMARGCERAGIALAAGAAMSAVGVPNLPRLLPGAGAWPGSQTVLIFDTAYVAVAVVGLALVLLGRLLARAAALQSEAAALRTELGEFF